jgi:hypothetical protein
LTDTTSGFIAVASVAKVVTAAATVSPVGRITAAAVAAASVLPTVLLHLQGPKTEGDKFSLLWPGPSLSPSRARLCVLAGRFLPVVQGEMGGGGHQDWK